MPRLLFEEIFVFYSYLMLLGFPQPQFGSGMSNFDLWKRFLVGSVAQISGFGTTISCLVRFASQLARPVSVGCVRFFDYS